MVKGTKGYERSITRFIEISQGLDFNEVCKDFIPFLPPKPARVLDAGSGAGQNAASLADLGFSVTAIEPMPEFLEAAKTAYKDKAVRWLDGSLPDIVCLGAGDNQFDFVLIDGVWHHLNEAERDSAVISLSELIKQGGRCALSLRNGPAGLGLRVFPTDSGTTVESFARHGFDCVLHLKNQESILPNKENVKWSRIVLQKR
ncbi:MAG: class I SAM-dependent methyltransferase [Pseudomonadota bacterium]